MEYCNKQMKHIGQQMGCLGLDILVYMLVVSAPFGSKERKQLELYTREEDKRECLTASGGLGTV
eukprot:4772045-Amphidinium_carterae.1